MMAGRNGAGSDAVPHVGRVLVVGGSPEPASTGLVAALAAEADRVIAVDRGLDRLKAVGAVPDLFCGDGDTASAEALAWLDGLVASGRTEGVRYDPHKDLTDLALTLDIAARRWPAARICATCLAGGNPDHALAVLGQLARFASARGEASSEAAGSSDAVGAVDAACCDAARCPVCADPYAEPAVSFVEDGFEGRVLQAGSRWELAGAVGARFSFVPLSAAGAVVSEAGMRWELDHAPVPLLADLGISNVIEGDSAAITCHAGVLAAWCFSEGCAAGA